MNQGQKYNTMSDVEESSFTIELADFILIAVNDELDTAESFFFPSFNEYRLPECIWMQVVKVIDQNCFYIADSWIHQESRMPAPVKIWREDILTHRKFKPKVLRDYCDEFLYTPEFLQKNQKMIEELIGLDFDN